MVVFLLLLLLLLGFFGVRILGTLLIVLRALDQRDLKLENVRIARKFKLNLLRGSVHEDRHVQEGSAQFHGMNVVVALEHDLEAALLVLKGAFLVLIEVTDTDQFIISIKFDRNVLSAEAGFSLHCVSLGALDMTATLELDPDLTWLINGQVKLQGLH